MRRRLIAANWKMHGSRDFVSHWIQAMQAGLHQQPANGDVLLFPSFLHLDQCQHLLQSADVSTADPVLIALGGQNVSQHEAGAYTGEISAAMLFDTGCQYALVGHSERRHHYGESSALVAEKFQQVMAQGLCPVLCIGETLAEREQGRAQEVVAEQLRAVLTLPGGARLLASAVVAYEPVWAIGTGQTASPAEAQAMHQAIRQVIAMEDSEVAEVVSLLYGGSVKPDNATELMAQSDIDGVLVGGASLVPADFLQICRA